MSQKNTQNHLQNPPQNPPQFLSTKVAVVQGCSHVEMHFISFSIMFEEPNALLHKSIALTGFFITLLDGRGLFLSPCSGFTVYVLGQ